MAYNISYPQLTINCSFDQNALIIISIYTSINFYQYEKIIYYSLFLIINNKFQAD